MLSALSGLAVALVQLDVFGGDDGPSPTSTPVSDFKLYTSISKGYSIMYPENWVVVQGFPAGGYEADIFKEPATEGEGPSNVNIICDPLPAGVTRENFSAEEYVEFGLADLEASDVDPQVADHVRAGDDTSPLIFYSTEVTGQTEVLGQQFEAGQEVDISQVAVVDDTCAWVLTLTTGRGDRSKHLDTFLEMAKTFESQ